MDAQRQIYDDETLKGLEERAWTVFQWIMRANLGIMSAADKSDSNK